jgi:hypothetical protein
MAPWVYNMKFLPGMRFWLETLSFMMRDDDDLKHPAQEQEEQRTPTIGFEFHRGLKNSATTFQAAIRQLAMTISIDSPTRLPIGTPSTTT